MIKLRLIRSIRAGVIANLELPAQSLPQRAQLQPGEYRLTVRVCVRTCAKSEGSRASCTEETFLNRNVRQMSTLEQRGILEP